MIAENSFNIHTSFGCFTSIQTSPHKCQLPTIASSHNSSTSWQPPSTPHQVTLSALSHLLLTPPPLQPARQIPMLEIEMDRRTTTPKRSSVQRKRGICVGREKLKNDQPKERRRGFNDILMTGWVEGSMAPAGAEEEESVRRASWACIAVNRCVLRYAPTLHVSIPALIIHDEKQEQWSLQLCINV